MLTPSAVKATVPSDMDCGKIPAVKNVPCPACAEVTPTAVVVSCTAWAQHTKMQHSVRHFTAYIVAATQFFSLVFEACYIFLAPMSDPKNPLAKLDRQELLWLAGIL